VQESVGQLYERLSQLKYYQFPENQDKLVMPPNEKIAELTTDWRAEELQTLFGNRESKRLEEAGMFGMDINTVYLG